MPTIYVSSAITGCDPTETDERFAVAERRLTAAGWKVMNPQRLSHACDGRTYSECLKFDLALLLTCCDAIVMVDPWKDSTGCNVERNVSEVCGLEVFESVLAACRAGRVREGGHQTIEGTLGDASVSSSCGIAPIGRTLGRSETKTALAS